MPQQKLIIIPVTLQPELKRSSAFPSTEDSSNSTCTIKTETLEISFCNGVDEHIIQTVMRELKHL